ncbi:hypothetical protein Avbf_04084, partial [Armadillidium vulgare]
SDIEGRKDVKGVPFSKPSSMKLDWNLVLQTLSKEYRKCPPKPYSLQEVGMGVGRSRKKSNQLSTLNNKYKDGLRVHLKKRKERV